ncbi:efflux transporter outer membrane subunit [Polaromonas sp. YR568]|uniref:efflux transporter outer membrane subunit n=1 Tax=Polaromonas sp. YR568 TaxID=1855301 RepID=UPI003137B2EF
MRTPESALCQPRPQGSPRPVWHRLTIALLPLSLAACAVHGPRPTVATPVPPQWQAPLPHQGSVVELGRWWRQQDPLLAELILAADSVSPTVASAKSNIEQARAARAAASAALLPTLDASASVSRSRGAVFNRMVPPATTTAQLGLQSSWEIDLFGGAAASRGAEQQRLQGSQALWHSARVSVAAEVATQYHSLRACEQLLAVARADAASRAETARLTDLATKAGFQAPATAALAQASAAEGRSAATAQAAQCDIDIKALVALTALPEPELRNKLAKSPTAAADTRSDDTLAPVISVPAVVLSQRPDIFNAAREVDAAHLDVGSARAERYPRLSLSGSIAGNRSRTDGVSQRYNTWSIGPLQLTVPLFDGGASAANVEAAKARYENATAQYRGSVRQAVREVEEALVNLQSTADRSRDAAIAADGYRASFAGTEARYRSGLASLVELEDARRTLLAAQGALVNLQRERRVAWVSLYRALGGGWTADNTEGPVAGNAPKTSGPVN